MPNSRVLFHLGKSLAFNDLRGDDLGCCKRCSFAVQKVAFWRVKDGLSQCKRWPFVNLFTVNRKLKAPKSVCCF